MAGMENPIQQYESHQLISGAKLLRMMNKISFYTS